MKLQNLLSYVRRACQDYDMISKGDVIAVGVSGGKDSLSLLVALNELRRFYPEKYKLEAIMVSLGLEGFDHRPAEELCGTLNINFTLVETDIGKIVFDLRKEKNPCSLCSKMRKAALNNEAKRLGCNKVALGHNKDDVCETFFLSLFYEGRIKTFCPVTYLDRVRLHVIRPLVFVPEDEIVKFTRQSNLQIIKNPCVVDGYTKREEMKKFIAEREQLYINFREKIFSAIQNSNIDGWRGAKVCQKITMKT